ncbi:MAG TPA: EamA family transporter RarD, partial [Myxococcaceae bacterium]|nr:EamA family transporter RarD [Myxococcaceae bacterium]
MSRLAVPATPETEVRTGLVYGLAAYLAWGLSPLYFKSVRTVSPLEIAAHRVVWSVLLLLGVAVLAKRLPPLRQWASSPRRLGVYALTTLLIAGNWLIYIWAVNGGRLLEASLGYFINPLVNVLLAVLFLGESLNRRQVFAVMLAGAGVLVLVAGLGQFPWVSLTLAFSFGFYGLVRKRARVDPVVGLLAETALLLPVAALFLGITAAKGVGAFAQGDGRMRLLLALSGVVTAIPLVWFMEGARRLRLSTLGLLQYLAPTSQFLLAV